MTQIVNQLEGLAIIALCVQFGSMNYDRAQSAPATTKQQPLSGGAIHIAAQDCGQTGKTG